MDQFNITVIKIHKIKPKTTLSKEKIGLFFNFLPQSRVITSTFIVFLLTVRLVIKFNIQSLKII